MKKFYGEDVPYYLGNIEKLIKMYGCGGYSVGSSLTYADLYIHEMVKTNILSHDSTGEILEQYPHIKKVITTVEANPKISLYLKSRKNTPI